MNYSNQKEKEFLVLLEKHKRLIVKIAGMYFKDITDRNDLVQEITLQLWKSFSKLEEEVTSSTWVYRIALNVAISYFRKEKNRQKTLSKYQQHLSVFQFQEDKLEAKLQKLYQLITHLNSIEKAIIILHLEGCKNSEIAEVVGISLSNVSTKIHRIKEKLIQNYKTKKLKL